MRTFLWVFINILKKIDSFQAFEKMLKNLTFWTSPKLESLVQSTWGFFFNGFRICFFRKKYFQTDCDLEKKWPFDSLRQPILMSVYSVWTWYRIEYIVSLDSTIDQNYKWNLSYIPSIPISNRSDFLLHLCLSF